MSLVIAIRNGFARLADIAPTGIWVLSDENDWTLVGSDFRMAVESVQAEHPELDLIQDEDLNEEHDDEVVEATS